MADAITQYLERFAEPEARAAKALEGEWPAMLVVPAYREARSLLDGLAAALRGRGALLVVVVNRRADDTSATEDNAVLLDAIRSAGRATEIAPNVTRVEATFATIALIDRTSEGCAFGPKQGVGLARRIGLDLCLAIARERPRAWLHTTDADVTLPANYFDADDAGAIALTYPYRHTAAGESRDRARAAALYEISLRYYLLGLRWAGSPYSFSAIGSTMAIRARAYAQVRGMPRRLAGEDFYVLEKLAKIGTIARPRVSPIEIRAVRRPRTPFGTAAALAAIDEERAPYALYDPRCFAALRRWLNAVAAVAESGEVAGADSAFADPIIGPALDSLGARRGVEKACSQASTQGQRWARLHAFFDGIRTLRFVHYLRDHQHATLEWRSALEEAPFIAAGGLGDDPEAWRAALEAAENDGPVLTGIDIATDQI